ncbi:hypothetical protein HMPREF2829_03905 [Aerococcus sp. HMSC072A12]|nr:hypothetical protein HMPREF2829_03905 [Aerococcus sp. HMSC072A12]OFR36022.1 hypothetical protein HMPREF2892_03335 [Aerococcus sp. HMSC061A03]OFT42100.1 hypothetical protein HMPREF3161_02585 [Aerococcus sp. HMSC06H08]
MRALAQSPTLSVKNRLARRKRKEIDYQSWRKTFYLPKTVYLFVMVVIKYLLGEFFTEWNWRLEFSA